MTNFPAKSGTLSAKLDVFGGGEEKTTPNDPHLPARSCLFLHPHQFPDEVEQQAQPQSGPQCCESAIVHLIRWAYEVI